MPSDLITQIDDWVFVDAKLAAQVERDRTYRLRERQRSAKRSRERRGNLKPYNEREFVMWDGEGPRDAGYALFGNSLGMEICHKHLSTVECLDLIIQTKIEHPDTIHVGFGLNYDVSMILKDLSWRHLNALKHFNRTVWKDYEIEYVPRHWFRVKSRGLDIKIFDTVSFFATDYIGALRNFRIRTNYCFHGQDRCSDKCNCICILCHIEADKKRRSEFLWRDIKGIREYMRLELELGVELMDQLRETFRDAGFEPHSWHGPGALARMALNRHHIKDAMAECPVDVKIASQYAFAGGRFEMFRAGYFQTRIYNADINSAYPYYATMLPNLNKGKWRHTRHYEAGKFAVYYVQYNAPQDIYKPFPLFRRWDGGGVSWPNRVEGWYWDPEAALVSSDPNAVFLEGWVFDEDDPTDRPFAWLAEYYARRQLLKSLGNAAEFTFKLIINSVYGQLAQRVGWNKKKKQPPRFHQLEWAGWITSACRAAVYKVAIECGSDLISIDTDGIYSLAPIPVTSVGSALGQWQITEYDTGIFWQSGIYALQSGDTWKKAKTRGVPRGSYTPEVMIDCLARQEPLRMKQNVFTGFGLALNGQYEKLNSWEYEPHEFVFGGQGKRYHNTRGCANGTTCHDGIHQLIPVPRATRPREPCVSRPHSLPWLVSDPAAMAAKEAHLDLVMYDMNDLDDDDRWVLENNSKSVGARAKNRDKLLVEAKPHRLAPTH